MMLVMEQCSVPYNERHLLIVSSFYVDVYHIAEKFLREKIFTNFVIYSHPRISFLHKILVMSHPLCDQFNIPRKFPPWNAPFLPQKLFSLENFPLYDSYPPGLGRIFYIQNISCDLDKQSCTACSAHIFIVIVSDLRYITGYMEI